jgi:intein/homing endonuclease
MAKQLVSDRIKFAQKGVQGKFILDSKRLSKMTWAVLSGKIGVHPRTVTDWSREKLRMSFPAAKEISKVSGISIPVPHTIVSWEEHLRSISSKGGRARLKKYGIVSSNEKYRKEKWEEWWNAVGQYRKNPLGYKSLVKINKPNKNILLAEFVGIMLGDGGVNQYNITITLSSKEKDYLGYVEQVVKKLFRVTVRIHFHTDAKAVTLSVDRKQLVDFCKSIGLTQGNKIKKGIDIPKWIKINKSFAKVCIKGLFDTDGCFYINSYRVNNKVYRYFKIAFVSASTKLLSSTQELLDNCGIKSVISLRKGGEGGDVRIVGAEDVSTYIKLIGSSNSKHLTKISAYHSETLN